MCRSRASSHTFTDITAPAPLQRQLFAMHPHSPQALTAPSRHRLPSLVPQQISAPNRTIEPFFAIRAFIAPARRNQKLVAPLVLIAAKAVCSPRFVLSAAFVQQTPHLPRLVQTISTPQQVSEHVSL